jgi:hypothetical protein
MEELNNKMHDHSSVRNFLQSFSIEEITTPLTLSQQEQLADKLVRTIKSKDTSNKLPDYLEEFRRVYDGPNRLEAKLPVLRQLSPRSKRMIALMPKPNEVELQKVRKIERMTNNKTGKKLYDGLATKQTISISQLEVDEDAIVVNDSIEPYIPKNTKAEMTINKAYEYFQSTDHYKKHDIQQKEKLERLFGTKTAATMTATKTTKSQHSISRQSNSNSHEHSRSRQQLVVITGRATSSGIKLQPMEMLSSNSPSYRPSSSSISTSSWATMAYNPLITDVGYGHARGRPTTTTTSTTMPSQHQRHASFMQAFTMKVYDEIGIDLTHNMHHLQHKQRLQVLLLHMVTCRLRSSFTKWIEVSSYLYIITRYHACKCIYRALRCNHFISQVYMRTERKRLELLLIKQTNQAHHAYLHHNALIIIKYVRRFVRIKELRYLVKLRNSVIRIQCVVRGWSRRRYVRRIASDRARVEARVKQIQCVVRRRLAVRKVSSSGISSGVEWCGVEEEEAMLTEHVACMHGT